MRIRWRRMAGLAAGLCFILSGSAPAPALGAGGRNAFIYGMHDYNGQVRDLLTYSGERRGWILVLQSLDGYSGGLNSEVTSAANDGFGTVVRVHWGYGTAGTLPSVSQYDAFASRAAQFIQAHLPYCKFYHIGNEPNLCAEWPGGGLGDGCCDCKNPGCADVREKITAARYADLFQRVYNACQARGLTGYNLCVAPTSTWSGDFNCPGDEFDTFDFRCYARQIYDLIPDHMIGGFSLHPKTHRHDPGEITSNVRSQFVFGCNHNEAVFWYFRVYIDMLNDIPTPLRDRAVFFTELNPHEPMYGGWNNINNGYCVAAFDEVARWNQQNPSRPVTAMMLYRWDDGNDVWDIQGKDQVHADLRAAVARGQTSNGLSVGGPTPTPTRTATITPTPTVTATLTPRGMPALLETK